eukprot:jgi/Bigna1/91085/estExt_fgenesh1_pg.C_880024
MPRHSEDIHSPIPCPFLERETLNTTTGKVQIMRCAELLNLMSGRDLILVDTRSGAEFKEGKLMRAINVPVTQEFVDKIPTAKEMLKTIRGAGKFQLNARTRAGKKTVIVSADGKTGEKDPAGAMAAVLNDSSSLCVLKGGFKALAAKFPFIVNKLTLPWFPTVLIEDFLLLGSEDDAKQLKHLEALGITHILNVSSGVKNYYPDKFEYHQINLPDSIDSNLSEHFQKAFDFLKSSDGDSTKKVLVHCHQGVSRSSTVVLAYLMYTKHWTLKDTYTFAKSSRPQIRPNPGFWRQLEKFEVQLFGKSTLKDCVDIEEEEKEYNAKNNREAEIGEEDEDDGSEVSRTIRTNDDPGMAQDKCDLCNII